MKPQDWLAIVILALGYVGCFVCVFYGVLHGPNIVKFFGLVVLVCIACGGFKK